MKKRDFFRLSNKKIWSFLTIIILCLTLIACGHNSKTDKKTDNSDNTESQTEIQTETLSQEYAFDINDIPEYSGTPYYVLNNNNPVFNSDEITDISFETYGALDELGRCTMCIACVGTDIMPTQKRESISSVKPTGWHSVRYDIVEGGSLYNRAHLIGFQLTGENANKNNLITGTRYLNATGMLPFENMIADYVKETDNHVMYRVRPVFEGDNMIASGVQMEAYSVEDDGDGICFNIYCYNVQPGVVIDYKSGDSRLADNK